MGKNNPGLGEKVRDTIGRGLEWFVELTKPILETIIEVGIEGVLKSIEKAYSPLLKPMLDDLIDRPETPEATKTLLREIREPTSEVGALLGRSFADSAMGATATSFLNPILLPLSYAFNALAQVTRLDPSFLVAARLRGMISLDEYHLEMRNFGFNETRADMILEPNKIILSPDQIARLHLRGELEEGTDVDWLRKASIEEDTISNLQKLYKIIPGPTDLIRMELREVFRPEFRPGLLTPPPSSDFYEWMAKQGYDRFWADSYWAAHWVLPSVGQGYEMFHRIPEFTEDKLRTLMRRQDILQEYHDNLIKIAYRPYTRVDVRRMYGLGILDREGVKRSYLDLGYDEVKAENMTEFTLRYTTSTDRDLAKGDILAYYSKYPEDQDTVIELLAELGYDPDEIEFILARYEYEAETKSRDLTLTQLRDLYLLGIEEKGTITARLAGLAYTAEDIERLYGLWDFEAPPKVTKPSRTDLRHFLEAGIIDIETWVSEMGSMGYSDRYIEWYYLEIAGELEE